MASDTLGQKIAGRQTLYESTRNPYEALQDEGIRLTQPSRGGMDADKLPGEKFGEDIYDGTAIESLDIWVNGLHSHHASPALNWFRFKFINDQANQSQTAKIWLEDVEKLIYEALLRSNFYSQFNTWLRDAGSMGTTSMWVEDNDRESVSEIIVPHPREVYIQLDKFGRINAVHRKFKMTLAQAAQEFGEEALGPELRLNLESSPDTEYEFVFAIYRNDDKLTKDWPSLLKQRKYVSAYIMISTANDQIQAKGGNDDGTLKKSALDQLNPVIWMPRRNSDEIYGRSPAMDAIVAINRAEQMGLVNTQAGHLAVNPPLLGPEKLRGRIDLTPYGYTGYKGSLVENQVKELFNRVALPFAEGREERLQNTVRNFFHVELFTGLFAGQAAEKVLTATQTIAIRDARAVLLGPILGSLNVAMNSFFERFIPLEFNAGRLPEPPEELLDIGGAFDIDYIGPLAQAQKRLSSSLSIDQALERLERATPLLGQAVLDGINPYVLSDMIMDSSGLSEKAQVPFEERIEAGEERKQQAQEAFDADLANKKADTAQKMSGKVDEESILAAG